MTSFNVCVSSQGRGDKHFSDQIILEDTYFIYTGLS